MKNMGRGFAKSLAMSMTLSFFLLTFFVLPCAAAEDFPARAITIIAPADPGGAIDLGARAFATTAEKYLGKPVVVVNKPGGQGLPATLDLVRSKADGYTIAFLIITHVIPETYTYFLKGDPPYTSKDVQPIGQTSKSAQMLAVRADSPWKTFADLVAHTRKNPGLKYGSNPEGTLPSLSMHIVAKKENIKWTPVPLMEDGKIITALLGDHIQVGTVSYGALRSHIEAKTLRPLVVFSDERLSQVPATPSIEELGYDLPYVSTMGLYGPKGIPAPVIKKLEDVIKKVTEDPSFKEKAIQLGVEVAYKNSADFVKTIDRNKANLEKLFKEMGYVK
jgi:tripartite-type tricarboxylate transporter receptor subunit TctC